MLSSIFLILTLPFSEALIIDSINDAVVVPYGISFITIVFLSGLLFISIPGFYKKVTNK